VHAVAAQRLDRGARRALELDRAGAVVEAAGEVFEDDRLVPLVVALGDLAGEASTSTCSTSRAIDSSKPRYRASPTAGGLPNATRSAPWGRASPSATPMSLTWPPRCSTYAAGLAAGIVKSSRTWKTTASSRAVRGVLTSVSPPGISSGSVGGSTSRKRTSVAAELGPSSWMPSSSRSVTCSLSGTRLSR